MTRLATLPRIDDPVGDNWLVPETGWPRDEGDNDNWDWCEQEAVGRIVEQVSALSLAEWNRRHPEIALTLADPGDSDWNVLQHGNGYRPLTGEQAEEWSDIVSEAEGGNLGDIDVPTLAEVERDLGIAAGHPRHLRHHPDPAVARAARGR